MLRANWTVRAIDAVALGAWVAVGALACGGDGRLSAPVASTPGESLAQTASANAMAIAIRADPVPSWKTPPSGDGPFYVVAAGPCAPVVSAGGSLALSVDKVSGTYGL